MSADSSSVNQKLSPVFVLVGWFSIKENALAKFLPNSGLKSNFGITGDSLSP